MAAVTEARARVLTTFFFSVEPGLWKDLLESGALEGLEAETARREWECLALYGCVRGLVAVAGFDDTTADAMDQMHELILERWAAAPAEPGGDEAAAGRHERIAGRYGEYGRIAHEREELGSRAVAEALGVRVARHMSGTDIANAELGVMLGELHEAMSEGAAEVLRRLETETA